MSYNAKNYTEQGGNRTVIGGELIIEDGAKITGLPSSTETSEKIENQAESTAETVEDLVVDFNALLTKLKSAGLMAED